MSLFSFFTPRYQPVPPEKLPKNPDRLRKLYYAASQNEDYASVIAILEKIDSVAKLDYNERRVLSGLYVVGRGCSQDLDKARELVYRGFARYPSIYQLQDLLFLQSGPIPPYTRYYYPDYDRILSVFANYLSQHLPCSPYDESSNKRIAYNYHLLRDLVYLLELGLKDVRDEDELQAFVAAHPSDWAVRFYNAHVFIQGSGHVGRECFAAIMNEDSLVAMDKLNSIAGSTSGSTISERMRQAEENQQYYSKLLHRFEYPEQGIRELTREFRLKYTSPMTAQEVLDTVYAEVATMVAATRAAEEAQRLAEAKRKEEKERQYQQALASRSGRLALADDCMCDKDFKGAEVHLLAAMALPLDTDEDAAASIAVWGALTKVYFRQKDLNRAMQCAVTFFDRYHERFPEDQTWTKYRSDALKLVPKALYFVFDHYRHGPRHETEHIANRYLSSAAEVFSDSYCTALSSLAANGDWEACLDLALHLLDKSDTLKQYEGASWLKRSVNAGHIPSMYFAAAEYSRWLGLSPNDKRRYLMTVAASDDAKYAKMAAMVISTEDLQAAKDKAFKQAAQEFVQAQRQAQVDAKMDEFRRKRDLLERDLDLTLFGDGFTVEERILRGDFSAMDAVRLQSLRDEAEARARKKFLED